MKTGFINDFLLNVCNEVTHDPKRTICPVSKFPFLRSVIAPTLFNRLQHVQNGYWYDLPFGTHVPLHIILQ